MPELPEVETVSRTLDPLLRGHTISNVVVYWPRTIAGPDLPAFVDAASGARIASVGRRAKLVLLRLDDGGTITIHLRMTGELRFHPEDDDTPVDDSHLRVRFAFSDGSRLDFTDVRKFGRIEYFPPGEFDLHASELGVEPLDAEFTSVALGRLLASRRRQVKPLLLDQSVVAGLGNIYVDEALFSAGIHPCSHAVALPTDRVQALHAAIVDVLNCAVEHRGTTLRNYRSGLGAEGENRPRLRVYGRAHGSPCIVCGTPLIRTVVGQRGTVYCPHCQSLFSAD